MSSSSPSPSPSSSSSSSPVLLITGANQGLGYACVEELIKTHPDYHILLGARSPVKGSAAVEALRQQYGSAAANVDLLVIDVTDGRSIEWAISAINQKFGRLDILIQNAAVATFDYDLQSAKQVLGTNLLSLIDLSNAALPLLRRSASPKVVIVSSEVGSAATSAAREPLKTKLEKEVNATDDQVRELAQQYFDLVEKRDKKEKETGAEPWLLPSAAMWHGVYGASKAILNVHARSFANRNADWLTTSIVCPGYCATKLNGYQGPRSVQVGAKSILYGLEIPRSESGKWLLQDRRNLSWS